MVHSPSPCRCVSGSCVQCCWEQVIYAATSGTGQERNSRPAGPSPRSNRAWSCGSARRLRRQSSERQRQKFQNSDTTHDTRHSNSTALDRVLKNKVGMYQSADRAKRNTFHSVCPSVIARDVPQHGSHPLPTVSRVGQWARLSCEALPPFLSASRRGHGLGRGVGGGDGVAQVLVLLGEELDLVF